MSDITTDAVKAERLSRARALADEIAVLFRFQGLLIELEKLAIDRGIDENRMRDLLVDNGGSEFAAAYYEWTHA